MTQPTNEKQMLSILDELYAKALHGIPKVSRSVESLAQDYLSNAPSSEKAAENLIKYQIAKCGTSGFVTGLGGVIDVSSTQLIARNAYTMFIKKQNPERKKLTHKGESF